MTGVQRYPTPVPSGGDVDGPASATDNALARFDGTTGKLLQDSSVSVTDAGKLQLVASGSASAGINIAPGTAPSSPVNGDIWTTTSGVYARINGVTQGPFESAAGSYQPASGDLTAIDALAGTSGFLKKTGTDTWTLDTNTYLTGNQTITLSGDASGSGTTAITVTVADDSHSHTGATISGLDAADTTTGTFDIARIPTGSTGTTVSLGNHTHAYLSSSTSSTQDGYFGDIYLYDDSTPSHYLRITNSANLTLARVLNINVNDADRTISLSGNLTVPSAATVSGTNTGNQTITLTGNVTGSGTGSFAATIANDAVTYAKMQNVSAQYRVLGRITAAAGDVEELTGENLVTVLGQATSKTGSGSIVFHTAPTFSGTVTATTFSGSGASLTSIPQSAVTNLTTDLSGKQPLDADLTAIAALAGTSGLLKKTAADTWTLDTTAYTTNTGTVTSVGMTVPTGLSISGSPVTTSGTLAVTLTAGYSIPTTASQTNWDTAYTDRNKWDGGATGLVAATGRTSLGGTTVGQNLFTLTNPTAVTFLRVNADNTVSALDAATFRSAIGAGTSSTTGTVTSVGMTVPTGLSISGSPVTTSGTLALTLTAGYEIPTTAALAAKAPLESPTFTGKVTTAASAVGGAGFNLPHGAAPTSPANGDVWTTTAGLYVRVNGSTVGPLAPSSGAATWGSITGTLSSQTDLNTALNAKAPTASPTFTGTVTASTITPSSGYLGLNYGGGGSDAVRSGQLQVLRDGVGDWNTLFAAYGTAAEVAADTPRFAVWGIGAFEATYEGKIKGSGNVYLRLNGGAGYERQIHFQSNGSRRWSFGAAPNIETGSNAGSTFTIARYSDLDAWIDNPLEIDRATGTVYANDGMAASAPGTFNSFVAGSTSNVGAGILDGSFVANRDSHAIMYLLAQGSSGTAARIRGWVAGGTAASKTVPTASSLLLSIDARGWGGTGYGGGSAIEFSLGTGTFSDTSMPGKIEFQTVPDGSVTRQTRLTIDQNGLATFAKDVLVSGTSKLYLGNATGGFKGEIRSQSTFPIVLMPYNDSGTALSSAEFYYSTGGNTWNSEVGLNVGGALTVFNSSGGNSISLSSTDGDSLVNIQAGGASGNYGYLRLRSRWGQASQNEVHEGIGSDGSWFVSQKTINGSSVSRDNIIHISSTGKVTFNPPSGTTVTIGAAGSTGGLEFGASGPKAMAGTGGPSGIAAPIGSTWRQTDANSSHGNLAGLLWNKVGSGTTEGTDWLVDYEGRWLDYTPTWGNQGGTSQSLGNGTLNGRYTRSGKQCHFNIQLVMGSTTTYGTSVGWTWTYPVSPVARYWTSPVWILDSGATHYIGVARRNGTTTMEVVVHNNGNSVGYTVPHTWAVNDVISITGTCEIA